MKTILIFDQAETAGGSIARAVDLANEMNDLKFIFITYHPLKSLYKNKVLPNIVSKYVYSFYNYQKKSAHIALLKSKIKNQTLIFAGVKIIALLDFINECSVTTQALIKTLFHKIDLVQANGGVHFLPYRLANIRKAALIYYFRHLDDYRWASGSMLDRASDFVFVGKNLMNRHLTLLNINKEKCHVVHSPFDAEKKLDDKSDESLQFLLDLKKDGYYVIVQAARICQEKGQHVSLDAVINLKDTHPKIALIFAGESEPTIKDNKYEYELRSKIDNHQLTNRVLLVGQRTDVLQLVKYADIALQSPLWFEALSGSLIEAMQLGVLTISADIGGASEAIIHNQTGLLFTAGDSENLAQLIKQVLESGVNIASIIKNGKEHAIQHWNPEIIQRKMRAIYFHSMEEFAGKKEFS